MDEMPCTHAMATIKNRQMDPYEYCSKYYKIETYLATYDGIVNSIGDPKTWEILEELQKKNYVEPPIEGRKVGRPKKGAFPRVVNSRRRP